MQMFEYFFGNFQIVFFFFSKNLMSNLFTWNTLHEILVENRVFFWGVIVYGSLTNNVSIAVEEILTTLKIFIYLVVVTNAYFRIQWLQNFSFIFLLLLLLLYLLKFNYAFNFFTSFFLPSFQQPICAAKKCSCWNLEEQKKKRELIVLSKTLFNLVWNFLVFRFQYIRHIIYQYCRQKKRITTSNKSLV